MPRQVQGAPRPGSHRCPRIICLPEKRFNKFLQIFRIGLCSEHLLVVLDGRLELFRVLGSRELRQQMKNTRSTVALLISFSLIYDSQSQDQQISIWFVDWSVIIHTSFTTILWQVFNETLRARLIAYLILHVMFKTASDFRSIRSHQLSSSDKVT